MNTLPRMQEAGENRPFFSLRGALNLLTIPEKKMKGVIGRVYRESARERATKKQAGVARERFLFSS